MADWGVVNKLALALTVVLLAVSCSGDAQESTEANEDRITLEELADPLSEIDITEVQGINLGELAPEPTDFCDAFASVPSRWLNDAVVPLQLWSDTFDGLDDLPPELSEHIGPLLGFAKVRMDWNFGRAERPEFTTALQQHAHALAIEASQRCPDLPLVLGPSDDVAPKHWTDGSLSPSDLVRRCDEERSRTQLGIDAYRDLYGQEPAHAEVVEAGLYPGLTPDGDLFFASDVFGVRLAKGVARPFGLAPCAN